MRRAAMFNSMELLVEIYELREIGLTEEEIEGYIDMHFEKYMRFFCNAEIV
jgi:hypothetical protein